jgi:mannose-1-phosphate guanylyltransferase
MPGNTLGNAVIDDQCSNVHVLNELSMPVLAMGVRNVVIAASPEGILVSDKDRSARIKSIVDKFENQIMFAEKSWGSFQILNVEEGSLTILIVLNPGHSMNYHSHEKRDEIWTVISGEGRTLVDGMEQKVRAGDVITIEAGCRHTVFADTALKLIEVQVGQEISKLDKKKYKLPSL